MTTIFFVIGTRGEFQIRVFKDGELAAVHQTPQLTEVISYELDVDDYGRFRFVDAYYTEDNRRRSVSAEKKVETDLQGVENEVTMEITLGNDGSRLAKTFLDGVL